MTLFLYDKINFDSILSMWIEVHIQAMSKTIIQILASWSLDISLLRFQLTILSYIILTYPELIWCKLT
jgi:hypothetical protein